MKKILMMTLLMISSSAVCDVKITGDPQDVLTAKKMIKSYPVMKKKIIAQSNVIKDQEYLIHNLDRQRTNYIKIQDEQKQEIKKQKLFKRLSQGGNVGAAILLIVLLIILL